MNKFITYYSSEIEKKCGIRNYVLAKSSEKRPLLDKVKRYSKNKRILEAGCGSAANSIFLANEGFNLTCIDKDLVMLQFAKLNSKKFMKKPKFANVDIKKLSQLKNKFDVSFSHGVLEHYSDKEIICLINEQLNAANFVIISVPSNFFKANEAINGDERFLSEKQWINLISKTDGKLVESFGYFYDSNELRIRILKILSTLTLNKLPITKPYLGFVVSRGK